MKKAIIFLTIFITVTFSLNLAFADFYVIAAGTRFKHPEVVSATGGLNGNSVSLLTVPAGKKFILTDALSSKSCELWLKEDDNRVATMGFMANPGLLSFHLTTGIPFTSEADVRIESQGQCTITITGYLIDN